MRVSSVALVVLLGWTVPNASVAVEEIHGDARRVEQLPIIQLNPDDWPWWRGPNLDGIARTQGVPLEFSPTNSVIWSVDVPGRGHASPTLWGDRVYLATADDAKQEQYLLAYDRKTGTEVWRRLCHQGGFMKKSHRQNSHASATPACDGERVFMPFIHQEGLWVTATNLDGEILWQTRAADYDAIYGFGSSPAIFGSLVIVAGDNDQTGSFMAALHRKTGEIVWRVARPKIDTYGTPIVPKVAGRDQLLIGGGGYLMSYEPNTGELVWKCEGPTTETTANTVAFNDTHVFVSGGYPKPYILMSVRADGHGDVTDSQREWKVSRQMPYVPSPLYHEGLLYIADDWGIGSCLDARTGRFLWTKRLGGDFTSSPVLCGDRIYAANEEGVVYVYKTGSKFELLAQNKMQDGIMATPTIAGGRIYLRTLSKLYCIGNQ